MKGPQDWKIKLFNAGRSKKTAFRNFTITYGEDWTGDITKEENIREIHNKTESGTSQEGVHLVVAGGASTKDKSLFLEEGIKQLTLSECLTALLVLKKGGTFVCKLYDILTEFTVGLVFVMYHCFEEISIKPVESASPFKGERFLICQRLKERQSPFVQFLFHANKMMHECKEKQVDLQLIPVSLMQEDSAFSEFIQKSNNTIISSQLKAISMFLKYVEDPSLQPPVDQKQVAHQYFKLLHLPNALGRYYNAPKKPQFKQPVPLPPKAHFTFPPQFNIHLPSPLFVLRPKPVFSHNSNAHLEPLFEQIPQVPIQTESSGTISRANIPSLDSKPFNKFARNISRDFTENLQRNEMQQKKEPIEQKAKSENNSVVEFKKGERPLMTKEERKARWSSKNQTEDDSKTKEKNSEKEESEKAEERRHLKREREERRETVRERENGNKREGRKNEKERRSEKERNGDSSEKRRKLEREDPLQKRWEKATREGKWEDRRDKDLKQEKKESESRSKDGRDKYERIRRAERREKSEGKREVKEERKEEVRMTSKFGVKLGSRSVNKSPTKSSKNEESSSGREHRRKSSK